MDTYQIVRFYQDHPREVIETGLTLEEAQEHCNDPETSSKTCAGTEAMQRTAELGVWFDGYEKEN